MRVFVLSIFNVVTQTLRLIAWDRSIPSAGASLLGGFLQGATGRIAVIASGAATNVLLARALGPMDRGDFALALFVFALTTAMVSFGAAEASVRLLGLRQWASQDVFVTSIWLGVVSGFVGAVGLAVIPALVAPDSFPSYATLLLAAGVLPTVINLHLRHQFLGWGRVGLFTLGAVADAVSLLVCLAVVGLTGNMNTTTAALAVVCASLLSLLTHGWLAYGAGQALRGVWQAAIARKSVGIGAALVTASLAGLLTQRIVLFVLHAERGSAEVGEFVVAQAIPALLASIATLYAVVVYSRASASADNLEVRELTYSALRQSMLIGFIASLPVALAPRLLIVAIFGEPYAQAAMTLVVLTFATLISGAGNILFNALAGRGHEKVAYGSALLSTGVIVATATLLTPATGGVGAAFANVAGASAGTVYAYLRFRDALRDSPNEPVAVHINSN